MHLTLRRATRVLVLAGRTTPPSPSIGRGGVRPVARVEPAVQVTTAPAQQFSRTFSTTLPSVV